MSYKEGQVEKLKRKGILNPLRLLSPLVGRVATNLRRPHAYTGEAIGAGNLFENLKAIVKNEPTYDVEGNFSNRVASPLYQASFGNKEINPDSAFIRDDSGSYSLNPDSNDALMMQEILNQKFYDASTEGRYGWSKDKENYVGGQKYTHPDLGGEYYKAKTDVLGDVYFDDKGNFVDYYNYGLDKGENLFTGPNLLRAAVSPFSTPVTVKGKAYKRKSGGGQIGAYSPESSDSKSKWYPGKHLKGLLGKTKELFGGKQSEIEQEYLVNPEIHKKHYQTLPQHIRDQFASMEEYKGTAEQNLQLLQHLGGSGVSIVDYLSGQGQGSSFADRKKLWESMGK